MDEVERALARSDRDVRRNVSFDWISNRVPLDTRHPAPPRVQYRLTGVHTRLGGDWEKLEGKRRVPLRFDFQVGESTLIQVDDKPHFSSARLTTLEFYDDLEHFLDIELYRELCEKYRSFADAYQRGKQAPDFPFTGGRTAQRAYLDVARDLLSAAEGFRLVRLPATEDDLVVNVDDALSDLV